MGGRRDKGMALARYLTGSTGIPFISWQGMGVDAPAPYSFEVTTSKKLQLWHDQIWALPVDKPHCAIRYDGAMPDVGHAWVAMKLGAIAPLLALHHESIQDRIKGE